MLNFLISKYLKNRSCGFYFIFLQLKEFKTMEILSKEFQYCFPRNCYNGSTCNYHMVHKIKYFEADKLKPGVFLQDAVNDFLSEKDEKIIAVHPVMEKTLLVHYKE